MTDQQITALLASIIICGIAIDGLFFMIKKFIVICAVLTRPMQVRKARYNAMIGASLRQQASEVRHSHERAVSLDEPHFSDEDDNEDAF
jgi:hypothetical protein